MTFANKIKFTNVFSSLVYSTVPMPSMIKRIFMMYVEKSKEIVRFVSFRYSTNSTPSTIKRIFIISAGAASLCAGIRTIPS